MGIDATIPENVPRERYQRIVYFNQGEVRLEDYVGEKRGTFRGPKEFEEEGDIEGPTERILEALAQAHRFFAELLNLFPDQAYGRVARAIGLLSEKDKITQDQEGRYQLKDPHST